MTSTRSIEEIRSQFGDIVDQDGIGTGGVGDLRETERIGTVLAADDQHKIAVVGQLANRPLAVGRRVADVFA